MKKIIYAFATVAALTAISCSKEADIQKPEPQEVAEKPATISAQVGDVTKVSADNAGTYKWQVSDKITVQTDNGSIRTFTAADAGLTTEFSGSIPENEDLNGGFAFYPASNNHFAEESDVIFHIPSELTWSADASNMPLFSGLTTENETTNASFQAVGGVLKLVCFNIPTGATKLAFTAKSMKICGDFEFNTTSAAPWCAGGESNTDNEIIIDFSANYSSSKVFYIPLPVVTLTGGFTITIYNNDLDALFSVTSTKALAVTANKLIVAPVLNCASETVLWSENFSNFSAGEQSSGITYTCVNGGSDTKTYNEELAGGSSPELLVGKTSGSFAASAVPTNGAETMALSFRENYDRITVSSTTDGVSISGSFDSQKSLYTATVSNSKKANSIDLTFANSNSSNVRIDDIKLVIPGTAYSVPTITSDDDELTIGLGETSAYTNVALANAVDGLGISWVETYPVGPEEVNAYKWISAVSIENGVLTVTASGANDTNADKTATLKLKATGAADKVIALTLTSALVPNPTDLKALAGDASATITFTKNANASSYLAYLHTEETETPATGGTNVSSSLSLDNEKGIYTLELDELTNDQPYYLYVKVNGVADGGYVAPSAYVTTTFTPAEAKGTADNPYTVAEALNIISGYGDNAGTVDSNSNPVKSYTKGYVVAQGTLYNSTMITYYISDDGTNTNQLQVFRGKNLDNSDFSAVTDLKKGDYVVVYGQLYKYKNGNNAAVAEINSGNYLTVHHPKLAAPTFTVEAGTYYAAQSVGINGPTGATIYYTTDESTPTVGADGTNVYSAAINVTANMTIKAIAVKADCMDSDVASAEYTIAAPTKLSAPTVTVSSYNHNSINFSWTAVEHANGYAISTDGGTNYGEPQEGTAYTWSGLSASTSYTIKVKAIGTTNGQYTDSDPGSCSQTTAAALTLSSIAVTTNPTKMAYSIGESFSLAGAVITATYSDESTANVTASCTTNFDSPATFTSAGAAVAVTISYTEGTTKTVDLNVLVSERYEKVTALKDVTAGEYVIVNDGYYLPNAEKTNGGPAKSDDTKVTISNSNSVDIVSGVTSDMTWTFTGTATSAMTIESTKSTSTTHYYLNVSGDGNGNVRVSSPSANATPHTWTIDVNSSAPAFSLKDNTQNRYCATYASGSDWRSYTSANHANYGDEGKVYLYKKNDGKENASVTYNRNSTAVTSETITYGDSYTPPTLDKPHDDFTFTSCTSDNENVAKVGSDGAISLTNAGNAGKAVITLNWGEQTVGGTTYRTGSTTYTLTINKATPTITAFNNPNTSVTVGETVTNTTTISNGLLITYISGNTSVATVNASTGVVTGISNGVATISATFTGNDNFNAATPQSYSITVSGGSGGDDPVDLNAPSGVSISAISATSFTASWTAPDGGAPLGYSWILTTNSNASASVTPIASGTALADAVSVSPSVAFSAGGPFYFHIKSAGDGASYNQSSYSSSNAKYNYCFVYSSGATMSAGSNSSAATVVISSTSYSAIKCGTTKNAGVATVSVPKGATKLYVHVAGWNNDSNHTVNITPTANISKVNGTTATSLTTVSDSGVQGNGSEFTLAGTNYLGTSYFYVIELKDINAATTITFTANAAKNNRFVIWGCNAE